ncbi:MAG: hypothetical protein HY000_12835 [Planctomycetes bacterium]|nr:hypothetical protein [Planctomycetota bacterium]
MIATTLAELGFDGSQPLAEVVLLKDGHHAGWRFEYGGVQAVSLLEWEQIPIADQDGQILGTVRVAAGTVCRAA